MDISGEKDGVVDDGFSERISYCIKLVGNANTLSKKTGISRSVVGDYETGKSDPSRSRLVDIANAAGVSVEWLATGKGSPSGDPLIYAAHHSKKASETFSEQIAFIPIIDIRASAGGGAVVIDEKHGGFISFSKIWLENEGLMASQLFTLPTVGDSMEPFIKPGDFILCSRAENHVKLGDGIYVIRYDDNVLVKRLQCMPGKVKISSDNPSYQSYEIVLNEATDFRILGKVMIVHSLRRV